VDAIPKKTWKTVGSADWIKREFQAFVDAIENDTPTEMTAELAAHSVEIITAAYRSAATGRMVELD
jgi:predicted dehydrogenase